MRDFVFPMFRANTVYEGQYLLGTSIARPLIAQRQIEIAEQVGADAVAHGATGKGNDQVRFEIAYYALKPDVTVIAPWREWDLTSRTRLLEFAEQNQIPDHQGQARRGAVQRGRQPPAQLSEGKVLEDPAEEAPEFVYQRTIRPEDAPDQATVISIEFERGDPVAIDGDAPVARRAADPAERAGPRQRHRPAGPGGEPLRRHEVPRRVRDARRHDPAARAPRHREHHAGPRGGAPEGRA